jgi:hypothetical protein
MNKFDGYVYKILKELDMSTGGLKNQSGSETTSPIVKTSSTQVNPSTTTSTNKKPGQTSTSNQEFDPDEMDTLLFDPKTNFSEIFKNPEMKVQAFRHISHSLADKNYQRKNDITTMFDKNSNIKREYENYLNQFKPLTA